MARQRDERRTKKKGVALRRLDETLKEWRFEPTAGSRQVVGVVVMSLGGLALGAGVYAGLLRDETAPAMPYTPYLLAAGVVLLALFFFFGQSSAPTLRVGDFGVGTEEGDGVDRIAWYQIDSVTFGEGALKLRPKGRAVVVPLAVHAAAARRIAAEAKRRIPARCELDDAALAAIGKPERSASKVVAEPPQVTNLRCAASDTALTFERDVRMCGACGAMYHRKHVPTACAECGVSFAKKSKKSAA